MTVILLTETLSLNSINLLYVFHIIPPTQVWSLETYGVLLCYNNTWLITDKIIIDQTPDSENTTAEPWHEKPNNVIVSWPLGYKTFFMLNSAEH